MGWFHFHRWAPWSDVIPDQDGFPVQVRHCRTCRKAELIHVPIFRPGLVDSDGSDEILP